MSLKECLFGVMNVASEPMYSKSILNSLRAACPKCGQESEACVRLKNDVLAIRDLDLFGQPSFWVYQPPMHQCPLAISGRSCPRPSSDLV